MNDTTIDPQKDAQATEEMLAMLDALEQDAAAPSEEDNALTVEIPTEEEAVAPPEPSENENPAAMETPPAEHTEDVSQPSTPTESTELADLEDAFTTPEEPEADAAPEEASAESNNAESMDTELAVDETTDEHETAEDKAGAWAQPALDENDELSTLVPDASDEDTAEADTHASMPTDPDNEANNAADHDALPQKALHTLETAAELKQEADALAAEVNELEQETASAALAATETLQDETEHTQSSLERTLAAAENAFNLLRERGITPSATALDGMDPDTLLKKLSELEARNQSLRARNEAIKARLAALK